MSVCASNEMRALELIQQCVKVKGPFTLERLYGGCSGSEVIKVNAPDKAYIARFWNKQWADYFPQDLACQLIASDTDFLTYAVSLIGEVIDYSRSEQYGKFLKITS